MFDKLFKRKSVIARHCSGPLAGSRLLYLQHLLNQGASHSTLDRAARMLELVMQRMALVDHRPVPLSEIDRHADAWAKGSRNPRWRRKTFLATAKGWLTFDGRFRDTEKEPCPHQDRLNEFLTYIVAERGLSPGTEKVYRWYLERFLGGFHHDQPFNSISTQDIDKYLASLKGYGWKPVSIQGMAYRLRSFFRHGEQKGWCKNGISEAIVGPRTYRLARLPLGPSWRDVERLLASVTGDRPAEIRDRAILLLLTVYALRTSEVRLLTLEDVDWEKETVTIRDSKRRRERFYQLSPIVGDAILRYLREVRPSSPYREVFLRLQAPHRPMRHGGMYLIVAGRLARLGISVAHPGPHCLRHACASHLLAEGLSLEKIGEHLGHHSPDATSIYAKVDLAALRAVADFDLGGVL